MIDDLGMKGNLFHNTICLASLLIAILFCYSCGGESETITPPTPVNPTNPTEPTEPENPSGPETPTGKKEHTAIFYMAGDNSLSRYLQNDNLTGDIDELLRGVAGLDADVLANNNLLVFVDKEEVDFLPVIWEVGMKDDQPVLNVVKQFETEVVSSDPTVIQEVVSFAKENYPAEHYGFVYWSHGDGWMPTQVSAVRTVNPLRYIGVDNQNNTLKGNDAIRTSIPDLARALASIGQKFDFLLFDACYMLSMEVAYELRNCTNYIIASPTETPSPGAPYDSMIHTLFDAVAMGQVFYEYYANRYDEVKVISPSHDNWHGGAAIGVVDCTKLDALAKATAKGLQNVNEVDNEALRQEIFYYDRRALVGVHYYFDMVDLMKTLMNANDFAAWHNIYQEMMVSWQTTPKVFASATRWFSMEEAHGMTHYIPKKNDASANSDVLYHSTSWYKDAGLGQLGW